MNCVGFFNHQKTRRVIYKDKKSGLQVYRSKRNALEILVWGENVLTPDNQTEFKRITVFPTGLRVIRLDGQEMCFIFKSMSWFFIDKEVCIFTRIFPFGEIAASIKGELLRNYELN